MMLKTLCCELKYTGVTKIRRSVLSRVVGPPAIGTLQASVSNGPTSAIHRFFPQKFHKNKYSWELVQLHLLLLIALVPSA